MAELKIIATNTIKSFLPSLLEEFWVARMPLLSWKSSQPYQFWLQNISFFSQSTGTGKVPIKIRIKNYSFST